MGTEHELVDGGVDATIVVLLLFDFAKKTKKIKTEKM